MDVSIIIVNYKTPYLLNVCIGSVYKYTKDCSFEIIVIDNDSKDNSRDLIMSAYPNVKWFDMGYNAGFGRANNKGIKEAIGEYVLLLNSDTELFEDVITKTLIHYKELEEDQKVGLMGCQIKHKDGRLQPSCNYYWAGLREAIEEHPVGIKILQHWLKLKKLRSRNKYIRLNENHEVVWLGVPYALINSRVIKECLFDEQFFMYSEDEELNYRLSKKGFKHFFFSETGVFHHIGASSGSNSEKKNKQIFYSKLLFILISRGKLYFKIYLLIIKSKEGFNKMLAKESNVKRLKVIPFSLLIDDYGMVNLYSSKVDDYD